MKKLFAIFLTISMTLAMSLSAQQLPPAEVDIADVIEKPGLVLIPVYVDFSMMSPVSGACAFDFTINFNPGVLTAWNGVQNAPSAGIITQTPVGATSGQIKISWSNTTGTTMKGKLLDLAFLYAGGCTDLTFVQPNTFGITEVGDCAVATPAGYPTNFIKGSICEEIAPVPLASWPIYLVFGLIIVFMVVGIRKFV